MQIFVVMGVDSPLYSLVPPTYKGMVTQKVIGSHLRILPTTVLFTKEWILSLQYIQFVASYSCLESSFLLRDLASSMLYLNK